MSEEQQTIALIRGTIADLSPKEQERITAAYQRLVSLEVEYGETAARMALALRGAELAAQ